MFFALSLAVLQKVKTFGFGVFERGYFWFGGSLSEAFFALGSLNEAILVYGSKPGFTGPS